ncbi:hypothetical protein ABW19_dt0206106 [Dactylella cylindrospora]|nr:hypothetical protein ABW19_dt0206106 [Dactylella cylindrospora]
MRFTAILSVAAFAGLAAAQSQDGAGKGCAAQNVLLACLGTQEGRIALCKTLDYACMCQVQADVLQCYDQCPNDILRSTEESKLTAYCVAASATLSTAVATPTATESTTESTAAASQTEAEESTPTESATETETEEPSGTETAEGSASSTGDADSAAAKITWMCASSLLAVLTAAFMVL